MAHFTDIRALTFDLDDTLVHSAPGLAQAIDLALADLQLPPAGLERTSTWIGNGADIMMSRALFDKHYADTVEAGSTLFP